MWLPALLREPCLAAIDDEPRDWVWQAPEQLHLRQRFTSEIAFHRAEDVDAAYATPHAKIDQALIRTGVALKGRAYFPHITLAHGRAGATDRAAWLERAAALASQSSHN